MLARTRELDQASPSLQNTGRSSKAGDRPSSPASRSGYQLSPCCYVNMNVNVKAVQCIT